ncbi:ABC transporter substrate-binding protein [Paenibacillus eucommiae]|uniref:Multiple sugar transport system substrate-binding protein n=1 Tax=Paenibacillus eucommiae TaxID=1355755 RepID=A0ABS4INJ4_9BACL|nr:sugar ABC transporter substrate-binding protein [Paenibacillus eucommiae]MBP1989137.1 multiple sugar transport system substrate-binding protein [Paenibacillus eucommiae]
MKSFWKKSSLLLLASVMILTGCGSNNNEGAATPDGGASTPSDKPYAGTEIRFVMAVHPWLDAIKTMLPEFEQKTGIKVKVESFSQEQTSNKMAVELNAKTSSLDVMFIRPLDETKLFSKNGWVEPLGKYVDNDQEYDVKDFIQSSLDTSTYDNQLIGIPITTEREILYYRKDLLEQNNIAVPTTMDELMQAAEKLHDPDKGMYGFVARGRKVVAVTQFSGFLYSFGGQFHDGDQATINTPEALAAFKYYGDMLNKFGPPGAINMHWTEAAAAFAQGKVALFTDADAIYLNVADPSKSTVSDKVGYAMFPAGPAGAKPYNVSSGALAISQFSKNKEAAAEFVKWATSKETVLKTQTAGNPGARQSVWSNAESTKDYPADLVTVINETTKIGVGIDRPQVIGVAEARDIISGPMSAAIEGKDIQAAADKAQKDFQALIDKEKQAQ